MFYKPLNFEQRQEIKKPNYFFKKTANLLSYGLEKLKTPHSETIHLGNILGSGAENICHERLDPESNPTGRVIRRPNLFGRVWQTQFDKLANQPFVQTCLDTLHGNEIETIDFSVRQNVQLVYSRNGKEVKRKEPIVTDSEYIEGINEKTVRYEDFFDPETGQKTFEDLIKITEAFNKIMEKEKLGGDCLGMEVVTDVIACEVQAAIKLAIEKTNLPEPIIRFLESKLKGVQGQMRNLLRDEDGSIKVIDPGMHDQREETGKFRTITLALNQIMHGATVALAEHLYEEYNKQGIENFLTREELQKRIKFYGDEKYLKLGRILIARMVPHFKRKAGLK